MSVMQLILQENYPSLGYVGDIVTVKKGYARNFLIPRGVAVELTSRKAKMFEHLLSGINAKKVRLKTEAEEYGKQVAAVKLEFTLKVGSEGKSFGSVSVKDIHKALEEKGISLERKQIKLLEPIKSAGSYEVTVQLHSDVSVAVPIVVEGVKASPKKGGARKVKVEAADEEAVESTEEAEQAEGTEKAEVASEDAEEAAPSEEVESS